MKLTEISIEIQRKYTKNFNSYGFVLGAKFQIESESFSNAYLSAVQEINKMVRIEKLKIDTEVEVDMGEEVKKTGFIGNKCTVCGGDTMSKNWQLCRKCYFESKEM